MGNDHPGVYWHKTREKWIASIRRGGRRRYIGQFDVMEDAIAAHQVERDRQVQEEIAAPLPTTPIKGKIKVNVSRVVRAVSYALRVREEDVLSNRRAEDAAEARQWVYYILHRAGLSYPRIGRLLKRHHTTVGYGVNKSKDRLQTEHGQEIYTEISRCLSLLGRVA